MKSDRYCHFEEEFGREKIFYPFLRLREIGLQN